MSVEVIPPEILENIFSRLDISSSLACSQVCSKWRSICHGSSIVGPGHVPKVMGNAFQGMDFKTLLAARNVCKQWKEGVDELTANGTIVPMCESYVTAQAAQYLIEKDEVTINPFPSRTVRISLMLREFEADLAPETKAICLYGSHIRNLIVKIVICSKKTRAMMNVLKTITRMLRELPNLQGLSIYVSYVFNNARSAQGAPTTDSPERVVDFDEEFDIPMLTNLKAVRLVAWNFSSEESEWLYYKILSRAPRLELFDPDFYKGISKFQAIFSYPDAWPFQLKCMKLTLSGKECPEVLDILRNAEYPLESIHLDIFEYSCSKHPGTLIVETILKSYKKTLKTLGVSFYVNLTGIPHLNKEPSHPEPLSSPTSFMRRVLPNFSTSRGKPTNLLSPTNGENQFQVKVLKLKGYLGTFDFLKELTQLETLIILDYLPPGQRAYRTEEAFFRNLPSLKELYAPKFGNLDAKYIKERIVGKQFLPLYW